jgi:cytochrome b involved in lipid metabolism
MLRRTDPGAKIGFQVYDVTEFADRHPGGKDFLLATVARDATAMFESLHDPKAIKVLAYL